MRISWPLGQRDPVVPTGGEGASIYHGVLEACAQNTSLRRLELSARHRLPFRIGENKLDFCPQLETLVLNNVPITLSDNVVEEMKKLQSLRLGGFSSSGCDPYAEVCTSLGNSGRKLRVLGVDVVGQALVKYLSSYEGLETLALTLGEDANDYCVKDLCERGLRYHEQSLKALHIDLYPHSNPLLTWFFEYWTQWIPAFTNLETLKVTTSMNLRSEFDAGFLVVGYSFCV